MPKLTLAALLLTLMACGGAQTNSEAHAERNADYAEANVEQEEQDVEVAEEELEHAEEVGGSLS